MNKSKSYSIAVCIVAFLLLFGTFALIGDVKGLLGDKPVTTTEATPDTTTAPTTTTIPLTTTTAPVTTTSPVPPIPECEHSLETNYYGVDVRDDVSEGWHVRAYECSFCDYSFETVIGCKLEGNVCLYCGCVDDYNGCDNGEHSYSNSVCYSCGYVCPHETWTIYPPYEADGVMYVEGLCYECGEYCPNGDHIVGSTPVACSVCGYIDE